MTNMLKKAFQEAERLSDIEQNSLAKWLLNEIKSDKKWSKLFAESEDVLEQLADEALKEHDQGKTTDLYIKKL